MSLYWIGYDLDEPGQNYNDVLKRLTVLGAKRVLKSDWLLSHSAAAGAIRDDLRRFLDANDRIIVAKLTGTAAWYNLLLGDVATKSLFDNHAS
jgi:hypothetical protein